MTPAAKCFSDWFVNRTAHGIHWKRAILGMSGYGSPKTTLRHNAAAPRFLSLSLSRPLFLSRQVWAVFSSQTGNSRGGCSISWSAFPHRKQSSWVNSWSYLWTPLHATSRAMIEAKNETRLEFHVLNWKKNLVVTNDTPKGRG